MCFDNPILRGCPRAVFGEEEAVITIILVFVVVLYGFVGAVEEILSALCTAAGPVGKEWGIGMGREVGLFEEIGDWKGFKFSHLQTH